jgi:1-deoxy-D-xylulose-5-phosphate reductoisomerase
MKQIVVLGSTGSIGTSTLDVVAAHPEHLSLFGIAARSSWRQLSEQTHQFRPRFAVLTDERLESDIDRSVFYSETELIFGSSRS